MGSFSKTFVSNGGFVATYSRRIYEYLRMYGNSYMFSNALSPLQSVVVGACLDIIRSPEGQTRRDQVHLVASTLRDELTMRGKRVFGNVSPIVPVAIGDEQKARNIFKRAQELGLVASVIEFPIVPRGSARFRLQAMATHSVADAQLGSRIIAEAMD